MKAARSIGRRSRSFANVRSKPAPPQSLSRETAGEASNPDAGRARRHRPRRGQDRARPRSASLPARARTQPDRPSSLHGAPNSGADACSRSCPITTGRCRPGSARISRRSPARPACPSSCTTFPPGPTVNWPTTRWLGWRQSKQFIGLRDATGDITRPMRLRSLLPAEFRLLSGDDATALAFLANGGDGCISMISNVAPGLCQAIYSSCRQGRLQSARYLFNRLVRLTSCAHQGKPGRPQICDVPARLYAPEHAPAHR